jgi:hypothetical protein
MIEHAIFPTLITEFHYPEKDDFKQLFYQRIFDYMTPEGYSNEFTGHVNIHHEETFASFFTYAINCAKQYAARLHIDTDKFEFNLVKTWMNIKKDDSTPMHAHGDAHISFTYYVNVPKSFVRPIRFHNYNQRNEPYPGSIRWNNTSDSWDWLNSYTWQFEPVEGQLLVFPSMLPHDTIGSTNGQDKGNPTVEELNENRICLAADILLTYKDKTASPLGVQPVSNWRQF